MIVDLGGGSGGSSKGVCAIKASWEEGYTCICYSGNKKLKAGKDVTEWIFLLPFAGEWTVEAGDLSEKVTVAEGEVKEVAISLTIYYYRPGDECTSVTGGWSAVVYANLTKGTNYLQFSPTKASDVGVIATTGTVDLSNISTLSFDVQMSNATRLVVGVSKNRSSGYSAYKEITNTTRQTATIDVSSLTGSGWYIKLQGDYTTKSPTIKLYSAFGTVALSL